MKLQPVAVRTPIRIALVNDHEVVVRGLRAMLAPYSDLVQVADLEVGSRDPITPVDVALYDTFTQPQVTGAGVGELVDHPNVGAVVVYTWNMHPELVAKARERKVRGYLSKQLSARELVDALLRVAGGSEVVEPAVTHRPDRIQAVHGDWPGRAEGLTQRQAEVIALITQGLSNQEICERTYITLNTLKTYIRLAYQRMGVSTRAQAVLWGVEHGMMPAREPGRVEPA